MAGYYLKVENNYVVVYMDDAQTLYMNTDILVTSLPDSVQQQIIHVMFMPDEAAFLPSWRHIPADRQNHWKSQQRHKWRKK